MSGSKDDYDNVRMDLSDGDSSDNEMFANKLEYAAFKAHFDNKAATKSSSAAGEYGGEVEEGESEYGGGTNKISTVGDKFGQQHESSSRPSNNVPSGKQAVMSVGDKKVERKPMLYGEDKKFPEREERRSKSRERHHRTKDSRRSGSREDRRRRSRDRDRRRSRSRSPYRGGRGRDHRHGRHKDHDRRHRDREEGARNHEEQVRKAREMGVEMPKYIKPGAVNPLSYAEQMQKRKALWAKPAAAAGSNPPAEEEKRQEDAPAAPTQPTNNKPSSGGSYNNWESTNFGNDKVNEKFRRLMGIKSGGGGEGSQSNSSRESQGSVNHDKIMNDLDRNYEAARQQTHRNRGIGLGFSDSSLGVPNLQQPQPPQPSFQEPDQGNMFRNNSGWQNRPTGGINFMRKQ